jgi:hypothetical protein
MPAPKIVTNFWMKPIPPRQFDWSAWRDGDEPNDDGQMTIGYGATEEEAIADLKEQLEIE